MVIIVYLQDTTALHTQAVSTTAALIHITTTIITITTTVTHTASMVHHILMEVKYQDSACMGIVMSVPLVRLNNFWNT